MCEVFSFTFAFLPLYS